MQQHTRGFTASLPAPAALQDYYVHGDEKNMLLSATDFCIIPSRFEPCGLVDIEFGWNGALIIGHDTGGLGKMPG
jgi:hypothetical protein